ncbi:hypothetical protein [Branchiibius cervicis]|uniref:Class I SAM-dependent methyltransferase n=1 Tax=Branchiibius cervicis TaxID=908252 RepID=A0ABW2AR75_9MICO
MKANEIGQNPWTREQMTADVQEFAELYSKRPLQQNTGGMGAPHMFATWFIARRLAPEFIVESGIWRGQSTWLLEQACPDAEIHSIDLYLDKRIYISPRVHYHDSDFTEIDWTDIAGPRALVFFDDHQDAYNRLMQSYWFGFEHVIFEDNYPLGKAISTR